MTEWDKEVADFISEFGTFTAENKETAQTFHIEEDDNFYDEDDNFYDEDDNKALGYVAWFADDHSIMSSAETPFEAYCGLY